MNAMQAEAAEKRHEVPPVCQLLVEKRIIGEAQMLAMLKFQSRSREGCLRSAQAAVLRHTKGKGGPAGVTDLSLNDPKVRYAGAIAGFLALALIIWAIAARATAEYMYVRCGACKSYSRVRSSTEFPVECPVCLKKEANLAVICTNGHIFTRRGIGDRRACPVCGASTARPLTEEEYEAIPK